MRVDCCGIIKYLFEQIGVLEEGITTEEAVDRIEKEVVIWQDCYQSSKWIEFAQEPLPVSPLLDECLERFKQEGVTESLAIDLGCGNSMATIELLKKNWKVIAVDRSIAVLESLRDLANKFDPDWIKKNKLTLVCQKMENYEFPETVQFIWAHASLPFCDPKKIRVVWNRVHDSLRKGGRTAGNFYCNPQDSISEIHKRSLGLWFTDKACVNALFDDVGYKKEFCEAWGPRGYKYIDFIGIKV